MAMAVKQCLHFGGHMEKKGKKNNSTRYACQDKSILVKALVSKINKLTLGNKHLKHRSIIKT